MFRNIRIGFRLLLGFFLIFLLLISLTLFAINRMGTLSNQSVLLYNHPLTVSNAVLRINTNIIKMHRSMKDLVLVTEKGIIEKHISIVNALEEQIYKDFDIINDRFLGKKEQYEKALEIFKLWKPIRDRVIVLIYARKEYEAADITLGLGAQHVTKIENAMETLGDFAQSKALEFLRSTEVTVINTFNTMYGLLGIAILISIYLAIFITKSLTSPIKALSEATDHIGRGQLDTVIDIKSKDEFGKLATSFNKMTSDLKKITTSRDKLNKEIKERKLVEKEKETLIHNMGERVKELQCLYSIAESIRSRETIEEIFMDIVALIPPGWHYPDITRGMILFDGQEYVSKPFEKTEWRQTSDILIKGKRSGSVEVYYLEECPELDEGPFLSEERNLINGIAHTLSEAIERKQAEEALQRHRDNLEEMVEEKTKELKETYLQLNAEIEEKLNYQAEALKTAELAALGELAAGVAHEINNPINGIINYAQMIAEMQGPNRKENEIANNIIQEGDRIANIVTSLLSFARAHEGEKSSVQINEIIAESISLTGAQLRKDGIKLTVDMPTDLPLLNANFQQLEQVVLNILNNARHAINEKYPDRNAKKSINMKCESTVIDSKTIVRLTVSDNGIGIPYDILGKVMNPFFTTKPANLGTGLGLSISHGIINDHGGTIQVDSVYGEFTNVIIDLPASIRSA